MYVHKLLLSIILLINYLCAQSVFNSFGLGLSPTSYHTSVNGAGSIGLVPTFHPGVSMENAATWPGLNYTFVSASYSNQLDGTEKNNTSNQAGTLRKIQFIIPISDRYGFGLSLKPLNSNEISQLMKEPQTFEVVKMDVKRGNIVLSRRQCLEKIRDHDRDKIIEKLKVGDIVEGTVKNIT